MIDLDQPPCCPECGRHPLDERYWPPVPESDDTAAEPEAWTYRCRSCGWEDSTPHLARLTWRTAPWARILAAEIARMRSRGSA